MKLNKLILSENIIPKRSRLFYLSPIGIGTPFTESLTGYISRLAEAHCIYTGTLVSKEIIPILNKQYLLKNSKGGGWLFKLGKSLNGMGDGGIEFMNTLKDLTGRDDLHFLTMIILKGIISNRDLLKQHRAWCPYCYEEQKGKGQVIYDMLLWALKVNEICPIHKVSFISSCPHCNRQMPLLEYKSRPGHCSKCGNWLGSNNPNLNNTEYLKNALDLQIWISENTGELIRLAPSLTTPPQKEIFVKFVNHCIEQLGGGNLSRFAHNFGFQKTTIWGWSNGKNLPTLTEFLRLCHVADVNFADVINEEVFIKPINLSNHKKLGFNSNRCIARKKFSPEKIKKEIEHLINKENSDVLSVKKISEIVGCSRRTLFNHFPDLCHSISAAHRNYKRKKRIQRFEEYGRELREITMNLIKQGIYPSFRRVQSIATKKGILREDEAKRIWIEILKEIYRNDGGNIC